MKETERAKRLQEEIRRAVGWAKLLGGSYEIEADMVFKAYVAGIQYAIAVMVGQDPVSILPERMGE